MRSSRKVIYLQMFNEEMKAGLSWEAFVIARYAHSLLFLNWTPTFAGEAGIMARLWRDSCRLWQACIAFEAR